MTRKISLPWTLFSIGITFIVSITIFLLTLDAPIDNSFAQQNILESMQSIPVQAQSASGLPIKLSIPKINIVASIIQVGLTKDSTMGVPKTPTDTAWYDQGPRPGDIGSAVIDGHYGWGNGISAVFDNLSDLKPGDVIYVEDDKSQTKTFIVTNSRDFDPLADASTVFTSTDNKAHLNLITCEGIWNKTKKSYSKRLVVFADLKP